MLEFWADPTGPYGRDWFREDRRAVLFCAGGDRSVLATKALLDMGFKSVAHLEAGFASVVGRMLANQSRTPASPAAGYAAKPPKLRDARGLERRAYRNQSRMLLRDRRSHRPQLGDWITAEVVHLECRPSHRRAFQQQSELPLQSIRAPAQPLGEPRYRQLWVHLDRRVCCPHPQHAPRPAACTFWPATQARPGPNRLCCCRRLKKTHTAPPRTTARAARPTENARRLDGIDERIVGPAVPGALVTSVSIHRHEHAGAEVWCRG